MSGIVVTPTVKSILAAESYGLSGDIGGLPRNTYYTPDGRVIRAIPNNREYVKKDAKGKVISQGIRDSNLDCGWLTNPPQVLKLYCKHCNKWHDTEKEITACGTTQRKFIEKLTRQVKLEETDKTTSLEKEVAELKAMVTKLMEAKV